MTNDLLKTLLELRADVSVMIDTYNREKIEETKTGGDEVSLLSLLGMEASDEQRKRIE